MSLRIYGATSGYIELDAPPVGNSASVTLPTTNGVLATESFANNAGNTLGGLVYITSQSFSAASSVSVNNCFSATYDNYFYIGHVACTSQAQIGLRLRVASTDNSTSGNYLWGGAFVRWVTSATVLGEQASTTGTYFPLTDADGNFSFFEGKLFSPFASRLTGFNVTQAYNQGGSLNDGYWENFSGSMTVTTSYTGFTIFPASGNISGSISIYGLRNS